MNKSLEGRLRAQAKLYGPERGDEWYSAQTQDILNEAADVLAVKDKLLVEAIKALEPYAALPIIDPLRPTLGDTQRLFARTTLANLKAEMEGKSAVGQSTRGEK